MKAYALMLVLAMIALTSCSLEVENINNCRVDQECVLTTSSYCSEDVVAINKRYEYAWEEEKFNITNETCRYDPEEHYTAVCEDNTCRAALK